MEGLIEVLPCQVGVIVVCGALAGDRFGIFYRVIGDCGVVMCDTPYNPDGTGQKFIGNEAGVPTIMELHTPGVYVFKPDGIVATGAKVVGVTYNECR